MLNFADLHALLIDLDGTLLRGDLPLPGLMRFFEFLQRHNIPFAIITNNTTETPAQYQRKLACFGAWVELNRIITGAVATAAYLQHHFSSGAPVYVIGLESLHRAIADAGFKIVPNADQPAAVVVVGGDPTLTYDKLKCAALHLQRGAQFVGTNPDLLIPTPEGLIPEAGVTLAAIKAATGVSPTVIGKPNRHLFDMALARLGSEPGQTAMLGDRLETDILGGQQVGLKTILITTGVDNEATVIKKGIQPHLVVRGLDALVEAWQGST